MYSAGTPNKKQKSVNDLQYAARYLIKNNYTCAEKLAVRGVSNGGFVVATSINQKPELFGAAIVGFG